MFVLEKCSVNCETDQNKLAEYYRNLKIYAWGAFNEMEYKQRELAPVKTHFELMSVYSPIPSYCRIITLKLKLNTYKTFDGLLKLWTSKTGEYFSKSSMSV